MSSRTASLFDNPVDDPADYRTFTHAPAPEPLPAGPRWFIRCTQCLSVAAVTEQPNTYEWKCGLCQGAIENMGKVEKDRLTTSYQDSVCDYNCTDARGPKCGCKCGGKNHGSHMTVTVTRDLGPVPIVKMPHPERAARDVKEWIALRDRVQALAEPMLSRRRAGEFIPREDFDRLRTIQAALRKAYSARDHKSRIKTLTRALGA